MQRTVISAAEGCGNALLTIQDAAQQGPAFTLPVLPQSASYDLHELVGKHGDKQKTGRGRNTGFPVPPAQIRTCTLMHPAPALASDGKT